MSRSPARFIIRDGQVIEQETIGKKTMIVGLTAMGTLVAMAFAAFIVGQQRADELEHDALAYRRAQQNVADLRTAPGGATLPMQPPAGSMPANTSTLQTQAAQPGAEVLTAQPATTSIAPQSMASATQSNPNVLAATGSAPIDLNATALSRPPGWDIDQTHESPNDLKARLDRMTASPAAREALNRTVINVVQLHAIATDTPDNRLRATLEQAVEGSVAQGLGSVKAKYPAQAHVRPGIASPGTAAHAQTHGQLRAHSQALQALPTQQPPAPAGHASAQHVLSTALHEREAETRILEVRPGDNLWTIAKRAYGDPYQYQKIFAANPRLLASPDHIYPGQILRVPL